MSEDRGKGTGPAFPELELDLPKPPAGGAVAHVEEEEEPKDVLLELDAPMSRKPAAAPAAPVSTPPVSMGPPNSMRGVPMGPPAGAAAPVVSMGPPPALAETFSSAPPPSGVRVDASQPPPSGAAALVQRAREAAKDVVEDPGYAARNVAEVGNRTSTALVMLGGAILLTLIDVVYARMTGERFTLGPVRLVWIAAPLALVGGAVLAVRYVKEHAE